MCNGCKNIPNQSIYKRIPLWAKKKKKNTPIWRISLDNTVRWTDRHIWNHWHNESWIRITAPDCVNPLRFSGGLAMDIRKLNDFKREIKTGIMESRKMLQVVNIRYKLGKVIYEMFIFLTKSDQRSMSWALRSFMHNNMNGIRRKVLNKVCQQQRDYWLYKNNPTRSIAYSPTRWHQKKGIS